MDKYQLFTIWMVSQHCALYPCGTGLHWEEWNFVKFVNFIEIMRKFWGNKKKIIKIGAFLHFSIFREIAISRDLVFARDLARFRECEMLGLFPLKFWTIWKKTEQIGPLLRKLGLFKGFSRWRPVFGHLESEFFKIDRRWDNIPEMSHLTNFVDLAFGQIHYIMHVYIQLIPGGQGKWWAAGDPYSLEYDPL